MKNNISWSFWLFHTVICFYAKSTAMCQFFWGPLYHDTSHVMSVKATDYSASIQGNMVNPLGLTMVCDLPILFAGLSIPELPIRY